MAIHARKLALEPDRRIFKSLHRIVGHCCDARNKLTDRSWRIMSLGICDWARAS
jgi:hypothetical protein